MCRRLEDTKRRLAETEKVRKSTVKWNFHLRFQAAALALKNPNIRAVIERPAFELRRCSLQIIQDSKIAKLP